MREYNSDKIVENITNEIWHIYNSLRGGLNTNDFDVVLLLLSAYKDGLIVQTTHNYYHNIKNTIVERMSSSSKYQSIISVYEPTLDAIPSNLIEILVNELLRFDQEKLNECFPEIFDDLLYKFSKAQGRISGEFIQPIQLTRFILGLADLRTESKIFNPFAGLASFGVYLDKRENYFGQELNKKTWALATLRLLAHNKLINKRFDCDNSIFNWPAPNQKFDLVVAHPPFNMRLNKPYGDINPNIKTAEQFLIQKGLELLSATGKLIIILPLGFLFRGGYDFQLRKKLVQLDVLDMIISLPGGLLANTGIPFVILQLNKNKKESGLVRFVDARDFVEVKSAKDKVLNDYELNELLQGNNKKSDAIRFITNEQIVANDYNLSVPRYFKNDLIFAENEKLVKLNEIIKPFRGQGGNLSETGKIIRIRDLKDDNVDFFLDDEAVEESDLNRNNFYQIDQSCLLLAIRWKTLKPTYFEFKGNPIFKTQDIFSAKVDESRVNIAYLINELKSEYVQKQLDSYRLGAVIPFIRQEDLLEIIIKLPSLEEQKAKVSGIIELSARFKQLEREKNNLLSNIKKEETESSTSLSHILGKPLLSIGSSLEIIQDTLSREFPNWKDIMISESREFKMSDAFDSISKNVKYIQELTDKNTSLMSVSSFNLFEVNFLKFISDFVKNERKSLNNNIELKLDINEDIKQMTKQILIYGNEQKLKIVLINLIDNAKNHAFINKEINNEINIEILPFIGNEKEASYLNYDIDNKKSYIEVKVSNTGKPFPKDFTLDDYIRKNFAVGNTRNRGLGGYEVNEIIKTHNQGKKALNLISFDGNQKYSSTISFLIPII